MADPTDLRRRRRHQTTSEIHQAALKLARQRGYENVTIEQISSEAGVSQRTFFNYFPTKEAAVAYAPLRIPDDLAAEFIARGKAQRSIVLNELISVIAEHLDREPPSRQHSDDIKAVALQNPNVLSAMLSTFEAFFASMAQIVARRLGSRSDEEIPQLIAGLALATVRVGLDQWSQDEPAELDTPVPYVRRAAGLLPSLLSDDDSPTGPKSSTRRKKQGTQSQ
ncbi:TetR family transcriptional regulator (plasmid) [Mycolicibacterium psychrotolerans]|uniref:TetR family transcriptional regulator n=1 Tax=Mycolicibacterium psychrotolerans TaxID=216929 RepID=UPI003D677ADF